jgi:hypothetical protein
MAGNDPGDPFFPADPFGLIEKEDGSYTVETVHDFPPKLVADSYPIPQPSRFPPVRQPYPPPTANPQYPPNPQSNQQTYRQSSFDSYRPPSVQQQYRTQPVFQPRKRKKSKLISSGIVVVAVIVSGNLINFFINDNDSGGYENDWDRTSIPVDAPGLVNLNFAINAKEGWQEGLLLDSETIATSYSQMVGSRDVLGGEATLLGFDPTRDIAIFGIDDDYYSDSAEINTDVDEDSELSVACADQEASYPISVIDYNATAHLDFSHDGSDTSVKAWELDVSAKAGCVIANEDGETVAMVIGPYYSYYALPISAVVEAADNIRSGIEEPETLRIGRAGYLGLDLNPLLPEQPGALVAVVAADGPAMTAGIKEGDSLVSIDGNKFKENQDADSAIRLLTPGAKVKLTWVNSKGKQKSTTVTVQESEVT